MPSSLETWQNFLHRSLASRLDIETFTSYARILSTKHPLSPTRICNLFLSPLEGDSSSTDPRVVRYIQCLLSEKLVGTPSILRALWRVSSFRTLAGDHNGNEDDAHKDTEAICGGKQPRSNRWASSYSTEETLFYRLAKHISSGTVPHDIKETVGLVLACIQWMNLIVSIPHSTTAMLLPTQAHEIAAQNMALGTMVVAVVENAKVQRALSKGTISKTTRKELEKVLGTFIATLVQNSPQSAARLEMFRTETLVALLPEEKEKEPESRKDGVEKEMDDILEGGLGLSPGLEMMVVEDLPSMNSRAGLYVFLNSLLVARPLVDDNAILSYLHNRYQGDIQQTIVDLILAAFDILANATFRNERAQSTTILRSFLINKIPLLLATLSSSLFPPLTPEHCVTEALSHVDTTAFPTFSTMFDESSTNNMFSDSVRQDFCFACCLHGLIAEASIEELLGDIPMQSLPSGGRYVKEDLVQQCLSDPERAEGLIAELEQMDGNVGAVSQAITEVIGRLCSNKETMSLKALCSQLARKPSSLDIMLLFDKSTSILQPICELLDNWHYDEDQGEYQPVYEEFGSILLLLLSFTYRYNLSPIDLGIRAPDSFVLKLLNQGHVSRAMDDLTEQEQRHLDGWIRGLFDNESGGLGDELMSSCPPQDFYLLVPTLFHHIVLGYSTKNLSDEGLKGGLEYLVDTFLLPSLIPGITWLSSHLWESRGDANAVLQILAALITNPASISTNTEANQMLSAILNIIAKNLEHSLRWLQRAEPSRQDVEPLSKALRGNLSWERRGASDHTELESWTSSPGGGLIIAIRQTIASLVQWGLNPGLNVNPAVYTHRQILAGTKILGAKRLLHAIVDEIKSQSETGNSGVVFDVAVAIVAAPESSSWDLADPMVVHTSQPLQRRLNLREALKYEFDNASKLDKADPVHAATIVRLYRKVEAQLNMPQLVGGLDGGLQEALNSTVVGDMGEMSLEGDIEGLGTGLEGTGVDGLGGMGGDGMGMDLGDEHNDLMQGLLGGEGMGGSGDLMGGFGVDDDMGDGMGF